MCKTKEEVFFFGSTAERPPPWHFEQWLYRASRTGGGAMIFVAWAILVDISLDLCHCGFLRFGIITCKKKCQRILVERELGETILPEKPVLVSTVSLVWKVAYIFTVYILTVTPRYTVVLLVTGEQLRPALTSIRYCETHSSVLFVPGYR